MTWKERKTSPGVPSLKAGSRVYPRPADMETCEIQRLHVLSIGW